MATKFYKYGLCNKKILFVLILAFFILTSCKKDIKDRGETSISVLSGVPLRRDIESFLDLSAEIKPVKEVDISSDVPGKIVDIKKYEGSFVKYGETIALVDRFIVGANYTYARARSPISGYVTTTYLPVGASVVAGTPIANVADISRLEVQIAVPERYVESINLGQKLFIRVPSSPDKEIEAIITKRDFIVSTNTRTLMVKGAIDNRNNVLLPGMFSDVSILINEAKNVIVVPNSAVFIGADGKNYIYVIREEAPSFSDSSILKKDKDEEKQSANFMQKILNKVTGKKDKIENKGDQVLYRSYQREINILFASDDKLALSGGLEDGEEVVMFGREFLNEGSLVNPIRNDSSIAEYIGTQTNNMDTNSMSTNNMDTNTMKTNSVKAKNLDTKAMKTNTVKAKNLDTKVINTNSVEINTVKTNDVDIETMKTNDMDTNSIDTKTN